MAQACWLKLSSLQQDPSLGACVIAPGTAVASSQASEGEQSLCFPGAVETRGLRHSLAASIQKTQESQTVLQFLSGW